VQEVKELVVHNDSIGHKDETQNGEKEAIPGIFSIWPTQIRFFDIHWLRNSVKKLINCQSGQNIGKGTVSISHSTPNFYGIVRYIIRYAYVFIAK